MAGFHRRRRIPVLSRNGKELFYRTLDNKTMVATYTVSRDFFRCDKPQLWSPGQFNDRLGNGKRIGVHWPRVAKKFKTQVHTKLLSLPSILSPQKTYWYQNSFSLFPFWMFLI
jgi:hypothetical protein